MTPEQENLKNADIDIQCIDCKQPFVFTLKEQQFFKEKGFTSPKRCRNCRIAKKARIRAHLRNR
jgi:N-acetylglutamate synthase-like GNAT family acetyltransferase